MPAAEHEPIYLDKASPDSWNAAGAFSKIVNDEVTRLGVTPAETELIKVRASQLNGCLSCLELHSRRARAAGITQQKLDILPAWRDTPIFTDREKAVLAVAEAALRMPLTEDARADLSGARQLLGKDMFAAAEWAAATINLFNRISILSGHSIRERDADGKPL